MAKKTKPTSAAKKPAFGVGLSVSAPSLVVDEFGVAWWVDPQLQTIREAKP